jgi:RNA polymerase sigma-70 factor (ECF subfamily)
MTSRSGPSSTRAEAALEAAYRTQWGRLLSVLVARTRRLDLAEDALGEAFARAAERWPAAGVPENPGGWLYAAAHRQILDRLRAEAVAGRRMPLLAVRPDWQPPDDPVEELPDDRLHLILLCCHPALPQVARSALALRLVMGMPTDEIARLFLVPVSTMAARLTRAKKRIAAAGIPLGAPAADELAGRLDEVCRTIYLAFTAGYAAGAGPTLLRPDLAGEAVRLATLLSQLVPGAPQVRALLGLLLLQHSRRNAREQHGRLVPLADQDRTTWRRAEIRSGLGLVASLRPEAGTPRSSAYRPRFPPCTRAPTSRPRPTGARSPIFTPTWSSGRAPPLCD